MPDQLGRKVLKIAPPGDSNRIQDVLDELYEVLYRRGYALSQGRYGQQSLMVLCKIEEGGKLDPVAQVAQIIPDIANVPHKGIDWRKVGSEKPEPIIQ